MNKQMRIVLLSVLLCACGDGSDVDASFDSPELEADCHGNTLAVETTAASVAGDGTSLVLEGTARNSGFAFRDFSIQGVAANNVRNNYLSWSVELPEAVYRAAGTDADGNVHLQAHVETACVNADVDLYPTLPDALR